MVEDGDHQEKRQPASSHYLEIMADFSRAIGDATDLGSLLNLACLQAARATAVERSKIMRYEREHGDMLTVAGVGWKPRVVGHVRVGTDIASPPGRCLQTGVPVVIEDLPNDPEFRYSPVLRDHGIVSAMNVPIRVDGEVWGVLEIDSERPRSFGRPEIAFLSALANTLGQAVAFRQQAARTDEAFAEAAASLAAQKTLLRELLHRDRNDFQLITLLLMQQMRKQADEEARRGFLHVIDRVAAIGLAHDQLAARDGKGLVQLGQYLGALCGNLTHRSERVGIRHELAEIEIAHDRAVPVGLIVNELVTNAIKHAFPNGREGTITVSLSLASEAKEAVITVADDGVGMGPPRPGGSGLELVAGLARQIGGRVQQLPSRAGTATEISFPLVV
ncbi:sensor histidine kinase [Arenibaculum pallidiluteum]|uniref:sensor histidine kinase n=1 Tax=Arenibaculum pallidiluteum TaxID=2812559 RepID=UPI001A959570|nr:GAF domain-containing protein [Arenibaculum pallidiluteum]